MITAARPTDYSRPHYYMRHGVPVFSVPCKSRPGENRSVTIKDCRALGLVPSPTTVCRILHRHQLVQWLIEQACLAVLTTPRNPGEELDAFVERVIQTDRVQDEERDVAAERGKRVHEAIQDSFHFKPVDLDLLPLVNQVMQEINKLGRVVATEKVIVGAGYCGTTDCILEGNDIWVLDFKTCRKIPDQPYDEQRLQISAYAAGVGNTGNKRIRSALVYVNWLTNEIKVVETEWEKDYPRFQLLLNFWKLTAKV
jgi:hypothetical protein